VGEVCFDGTAGDEEPAADLSVAEPFGDELHDLALVRTERLPTAVGPGRPSAAPAGAVCPQQGVDPPEVGIGAGVEVDGGSLVEEVDGCVVAPGGEQADRRLFACPAQGAPLSAMERRVPAREETTR